MRRLVLATRNKGKIREIRELLTGLPVELVGLDQYPDAPEVDETGTSFAENAILKAKTIAEFTGELTLADDSGLEVDYLGGEPGIYSARYGEPGWNDIQRYQYLLEKLTGVPEAKRTARFHSVVAVYDPSRSSLETAEGTVPGVISLEPRGNQGFGYDPVFNLPEYGRSMAELSEEEKNQVSHRGRAIVNLRPRLAEILNQG